jgi:hypothetical protein
MPDFQAWDLLALFIIGLIGSLVTGFNLKRQPTPVGPVAVPGPSPVQVTEDKKEAAAEQAAQVVHEKEVVKATQDHDQAVAKQVQELEQKTLEAKDDTSKTNEDLLNIGKQMRD